jgi:hypothetical protein
MTKIHIHTHNKIVHNHGNKVCIVRACYLGLVTITLCLGLMIACSDPLAPISCKNKQDCPANHLCIESACEEQEVVSPAGMSSEFQCLTNEECMGVEECAAQGCRCVEGLCFPNECQTDEKRSCEAVCGTGEQVCSNGVWRACNTQPRNEICGTMMDEDCDGTVDEGCTGCEDGDERACDNGCGAGVERCFDNSFRGCTATRPTSEICGSEVEAVDEDCDGTVDEGCDQCEEGSTRPCNGGCGAGEETCIENTWRNCSAPKPINEVCDGVDNDCDSMIDEEITRDCSTACGSGLETCTEGAWVECSANTMCMCGDLRVDSQNCGVCGARQRTCVENSDEWADWGECVESGQCVPGESEEGGCGLCGVKRRNCGADCIWTGWQECQNEKVCEAGQIEEESCTQGCGIKKRTCSDDCFWSEWSDCTNFIEEECEPNAMETESCGLCGQKTRGCGSSCLWEEWSACQNEGICEPSETEDRNCGDGECAVETRACNNQCQWEDWGMCNEGGSCTPGEMQESDCGNCGTKTRVCGMNCGWEDWSACQNESNVCAPGDEERLECGESEEGECRLGEQRRTCTEACTWDEWSGCNGVVYPSEEICGNDVDENCNGVLERNPDPYETNNSCRSCTLLEGTNPDRLELSANMDSYEDTWDYFCFYVSDGFSFFASHIEVTLTDVPASADLDLFLYQGLNSDNEGAEESAFSKCEQSNSIESSALGRGSDESIDWTERTGFGADDGGLYIVGVKAYGNQSFSCYEDYDLYIHGLR